MSAVSQSYPNYLGGLNEQPDELKKPGQLVEALNVIPDPVIGLTRRPGFKWVPFSKGNLNDIPPDSMWFDWAASNLVNQDYMYFGCINPHNGQIKIFNQDGEMQRVRYTSKGLPPHQEYYYKNNTLKVYNSNGERLLISDKFDIFDQEDAKPIDVFDYEDAKDSMREYFTYNDVGNPLKHVGSKRHLIFTNPKIQPTMSKRDPSKIEMRTYYSFLELKVMDTANYNYDFLLFTPTEDGEDSLESYRTISEITIESIDSLSGDLGRDQTLPLLDQSPLRREITEVTRDGEKVDLDEPAVIEVEVKAQVTQNEASNGSYNNFANYSFFPKIIYGGKGAISEDEFDMAFDPINGITVDMVLVVEDTTKVTETKNSRISPGLDIGDMSAYDILRNLADDFESKFKSDLDLDDDEFKVVRVGNGLYLEAQAPFSVASTEIAVADVINSQKEGNDLVPMAIVTDVSDLPTHCYDGFEVRVTNSFNGDNDYYLMYQAESLDGSDEDAKADGYWVEIAKPFEYKRFNSESMPHMITQVQDKDKDEFVFIVSPIRWQRRTVGTFLYNPSFIQDESPITSLNYYKNRLIMLTQSGTIVTSRSDDISNIFANTALTTSPIDPIDVVANANNRVPLYASNIVNNGILVFGDSEQYMFTTSNDILSSDTVNVTKVANYTFNKNSSPVNLGVNIGFISGGSTRFYEATNLYDRGPIDINERSQQIQSQFSEGFNQCTSSREQSQAVFWKRNLGNRSGDNLYVYRFRQENSQESSQTSWVRWKLGNRISHVAMPRNKMFVVVYIKQEADASYSWQLWSVDSAPPPDYDPDESVYLDGYYMDQGKPVGSKYETRITFPTIYPRNKDSSDVTANLTIHRLKLSTGMAGVYELDISRYGYDPYHILVEQTHMDAYLSDAIPVRGQHIETVPIYTRNKNLRVTMRTDYDAPLILHSMSWEGDYNRPFYKSV